MHCENHPERQASARCLYCWKSICTDCQIRGKNQSFCSQRCYYLFFIKNIRLRASQLFFRHNLYLRSRLHHLNKYSTLLLILFIFGLGSLLLYSNSTEERYTSLPQISPPARVNKITHEQPSQSKNLSKAKPAPAASSTDNSSLSIAEETSLDFHISLAPHHHKQPFYMVDIYGDAPPSSIIALYKNDRLCDTVPSRRGRFLFPRVGLRKNKNILQAKLITADGNFCYSNTLELVVDVDSAQVKEKGLDIRRGNIQQPRICLSFDSGESADESLLILDILKRAHIQTTIFLTGEFIRRNPKIVRRIVKDGHEVGNHTDTHPHLAKFENRHFKCLPGVNREFLQRELKKAEEAFYCLTGKHMSPYWRSPYGENNLQIRKWAEELGYTHVSWTCGRAWEDGLDSLDWVANTESIKYHTAEEIRDQIVNFKKGTKFGANGGIVLMHFSTSRPPKDAVYLKLPEIIAGLRKRGYKIVKISQLLTKDTVPMRKTVAKSSLKSGKGLLKQKARRRSVK